MKTISAEEFKRLYGAQGLAMFSQQAPQPQPSLGQRLGDTGMEMREKVGSAIQGTGEFAGKSDLNRGVNTVAAVGEGILGGAYDLLPSFARKGLDWVGNKIGQGFSKVTEKVGDSELFKGAAGTTTATPNNPQDYIPNDTSGLEDKLGTVAGAGAIAGTILAAEGGANTLRKSVNLTKKVATATSDAFSDTANAVKNKIPGMKPNTPADIESAAIKDATPNYEASTPTQKGKLLGRVEEGGALKGRTVKPNALETEAGKELSKVPGYDPNATKLAKYQVTKAEVARRGQALENSLGKEKVVVPKREVTSRVNKVVNDLPNKSLLLQSSDPVIQNYMRVFKNAFKDLPGTLKGVLKLRKLLDDAYENARGKQAFGSDKISALDDVNKAVRDTLYDYLVEKAQATDVKAGLRSQWNLYRALDELQIAAEKESGSIVGRFKQNNPLLNKVGEMGVKAAGFGAGLGIIK